MSIIYNGTTLQGVNYSSTKLTSVKYNGTTVFSGEKPAISKSIEIVINRSMAKGQAFSNCYLYPATTYTISDASRIISINPTYQDAYTMIYMGTETNFERINITFSGKNVYTSKIKLSYLDDGDFGYNGGTYTIPVTVTYIPV